MLVRHMARESLLKLLKEVRSCQLCEDELPLGPNPVVQVGRKARVVIVGQAPGTKVHESGVPWEDASGDHLRDWLQMSSEDFYNRQTVAIVPMGFCYPGKKGQGDAPPRPECAPKWHTRLLAQCPKDRLILLVGQYAQKHYLGSLRKKTLTDTVKNYQAYLPQYFVLPHPSWRSKLWMEKNPWFRRKVLPVLRREIRQRSNH